MTAVDGSATAWTLALMRNGADPEFIAAYMVTELAADPLVYQALMTDREIEIVRRRQLLLKFRDLAPALRALGPVFGRLSAAVAAINTGQPTGMPPEVEARITAALKETRDAH